jgi:MoxR-like ATPase
VALQNGACAFAFLNNRDHVIPDDIKALAPHVLSHRLIPSGGKKAKTIVDKLLNSVIVET